MSEEDDGEIQDEGLMAPDPMGIRISAKRTADAAALDESSDGVPKSEKIHV